MGSNSPELSLDLKPADVNKAICGFLRELSTIGDISEKQSKLEEYVKSLEEEMRKINAFKRELPFCMLLLTDAINILKEEIMHFKTLNVRPEMEEFVPLKSSSNEDSGDKQGKEDCTDKKNWMSSVQLWNSNGSSNSELNHDRKQKSGVDVKERIKEDNKSGNQFQPRNRGGAFMPFKGYSCFPPTARKEDKELPPLPDLSLLTYGMKTQRAEPSFSLSLKRNEVNREVPSSSANVQSNLQTTPQPQQQALRKRRRCWSPELHRNFVYALRQLGGPHVATPKQIREFMNVDGLTNDEVKSHLQKFRLHSRRIPTAASPVKQPMLVLGELWMPPDQYGASSKPSTSTSGSPQGPLHLAGTARGISSTGGESLEDEDGKSESHNWKGHRNKSGEEDV